MRSRSRTSASRPSIAGAGLFGRQRFQHRVKRRLRIFDHQQPRGAEGNDAIADFRADRAAAAGDDDGLALHEGFQPPVVDLHARPQQQILDIDRREPQRLPAFVERRQPAGGQAKTLAPSSGSFPACTSGSSADGVSTTRATGRPRAGEIADDAFEIVEIAQHRDAAHRSGPGPPATATGCRPARFSSPRRFRSRAAARRRRRRGRGPASESDSRRHRLLARARIAEIAIGDARPAEKEHLQEPIENDRDLAEKERAVENSAPPECSRAPAATPPARSTARKMLSRSGSEANRHFAL